MKLFKVILCCLLLLNFAYCAGASVAINAMNASIAILENVVKEQNKTLKRIVNLEKKVLLEDKKSIFLTKQRNELIVNSLHIEATNEKNSPN